LIFNHIIAEGQTKSVLKYFLYFFITGFALTATAQDTLFFDDFENGIGNWEITNDGGDCVWEVVELFGRNYTLPSTASGFVFSADADQCGSNSSTITTATMSESIFINGCPFWIVIEFDNDWRITDTEDEAYVEVSGDGGISWQAIWSRIGVSERNSHEIIPVPYSLNPANFLLRFRTVQPGWDWWWAIDNVIIWYDIPLTVLNTPTNLQAISGGGEDIQVDLSWEDNSTWELGFRVERKLGDPLSANSFTIIGETGANVTTYLDTTVLDSTIYTYRVQAFEHPLNTSCYSNLATVLAIIPVELTSFDGNIVDGNVQLEWSTATETNNSGFSIERRQKSNVKRDMTWNEIGFIQGHGTTTEPQSYSFMDESILSGIYQYRLKQIDYDGSYEYSNLIEVEIGIPTEYSLEQNYPNPFNPTTKIRFSIPALETGHTPSVQLIIYDVLGNKVATLINEEKEAGVYEVEFSAQGGDAYNLTSGIYFYRLTAGDPSTSSGQSFTATKKMIILK